MTEIEELQYQDVLVGLASAMQQLGTRRVLSDFQAFYPQHFEEIRGMVPRLSEKPIAKLLQKPPVRESGANPM